MRFENFAKEIFQKFGNPSGTQYGMTGDKIN